MNIQLKYIGLIQNSSIQIDGLTVVAGKNNSGKTTVGKTLFSLLDSVSDLQKKVDRDKRIFIRKRLQELPELTPVLSVYFRYNSIITDKGNESDYPMMKRLYRLRSPINSQSSSDYEEYAYALFAEFQRFDSSTIPNDIFSKELDRFLRHSSSLRSEGTIIETLESERVRALTFFHKLFEDLNRDPERLDYIQESIFQTLNREFSNQIQPISGCPSDSEITLTDENGTNFHVAIHENKVVSGSCLGSFYHKVFLIDDPYVIDDDYSLSRSDLDEYRTNTLLDRNRILGHREKLRQIIHHGSSPTVLEQTVLNASLKAIQDQIDKVLPGEIQFSENGEYYITRSGAKLKLSNLATGSKIFSMIKILLERGELTERTMLILDEPEAHLHPKWQNQFAEIIVLLVKELHINVLLTTHSSNFVLALDAYMRKHEISDQTNFYQTSELENGFVDYFCVNEHIDSIYGDFLDYLSEVKVLRDRYLLGEKNDE